MFKISVKVLLFVFLAGCGFSPMNALKNDHSIIEMTDKVKILPIENKLGFQLYEELENKLNPYKENKDFEYVLSVNVEKFEFTNQIIQDDYFSNRAKLVLNGNYVLKDKKGKILVQNTDSVSGMYNILENGYATYSTIQKTEENLIQILADMISIRIISYFKNEVIRAS